MPPFGRKVGLALDGNPFHRVILAVFSLRLLFNGEEVPDSQRLQERGIVDKAGVSLDVAHGETLIREVSES